VPLTTVWGVRRRRRRTTSEVACGPAQAVKKRFQASQGTCAVVAQLVVYPLSSAYAVALMLLFLVHQRTRQLKCPALGNKKQSRG
jgi:hypothetical protein